VEDKLLVIELIKNNGLETVRLELEGTVQKLPMRAAYLSISKAELRLLALTILVLFHGAHEANEEAEEHHWPYGWSRFFR